MFNYIPFVLVVNLILFIIIVIWATKVKNKTPKWPEPTEGRIKFSWFKSYFFYSIAFACCIVCILTGVDESNIVLKDSYHEESKSISNLNDNLSQLMKELKNFQNENISKIREVNDELLENLNKKINIEEHKDDTAINIYSLEKRVKRIFVPYERDDVKEDEFDKAIYYIKNRFLDELKVIDNHTLAQSLADKYKALLDDAEKHLAGILEKKIKTIETLIYQRKTFRNMTILKLIFINFPLILGGLIGIGIIIYSITRDIREEKSINKEIGKRKSDQLLSLLDYYFKYSCIDSKALEDLRIFINSLNDLSGFRSIAYIQTRITVLLNEDSESLSEIMKERLKEVRRMIDDNRHIFEKFETLKKDYDRKLKSIIDNIKPIKEDDVVNKKLKDYIDLLTQQ